MALTDTTPSPTKRKVASQGVLLFAGFGLAQGCSFARNALLGHLLSKGDFGIAATITLTLQMLETATDVAADRFVIQSDTAEGDPAIMGVAHAVQLIRAVVIGALLWLAAPWAAGFFHVPEAAWAFRAAALALFLKGFTHLDSKRLQKALDNRAAMVLEVAPQAVALALTWPAVILWPSFEAIVWLTLAQAILTVVLSQIMARRRWSLAWDAAVVRRLVTFSWPIWLAALPFAAVYQGDRMIIGHYLGIEALAGYTAAFLVTMVPGLIASRVAFSLVLPMLAQVKDRAQAAAFGERLSVLSEATALMTGLYAVFFMMAGGAVMALAFGPNYTGLHAVTAALAVMWSARMLQAVPGTALMALGRTDIYPIASVIRAGALVPAFWCAATGSNLVLVALAGALGEAAAFLYVTAVLAKERPGSGLAVARSAGVLCVALAVAVVAGWWLPATDNAAGWLAGAGIAMILTLAASAPLVPSIIRTAGKLARLGQNGPQRI